MWITLDNCFKIYEKPFFSWQMCSVGVEIDFALVEEVGQWNRNDSMCGSCIPALVVSHQSILFLV